MSNDHIFKHRAASSLKADPHGGGVVFALQWADEAQDSSLSQIWLHDGSECRPLTGEADNAYGAVWSPDGRQIACIKTVNDTPQVVSLRPGAHAPVQCLSSFQHGAVALQQWCEKSGRLLAIAQTGKLATQAPREIDFLPYKLDGSGMIVGEGSGLFALEQDGSASHTLVEGGGKVSEARWSSDGARLAYVQNRNGAQRHRMDLWLAGPLGESPRQVTNELPSISGLAWSPDTTRIAFAGSREEGDSMSRLYVIQVDTGGVQCVGTLEVATPTCIEWAKDGESLIMTEAWRGLQRVVSVDMEGNVTPRVKQPEQVLEWARSGDTLFYFGVGPTLGPDLYRSDLHGNNAQRLTHFNQWRERGERVVQARTFSVPDGDGGQEDIEGWLLMPPGDGPFPLLVDMHGGPQTFLLFDHATHVHWPMLIQRGWAVLAMNTVGSGSYGEAFADRLRGHWGELDLPQYLAVLEALKEEGTIDDRIACFGHSYGGFLAAWTMSKPGPWRAGVISGPVINLESHAGTSDTGYYVSPYALRAELLDQRAEYRRLSPISYAQQVVAPVLILQGEEDQRCPIGQAEEFFSSLVRANKTKVKMVVFPEGSHHVSSTGRPSHRQYYYDSLVDWVVDHVREA